MVIGFIIWSICAAVFLGIGISCRRSNEAVGFFTFVKPPAIKDVEHYNTAVSNIWVAAAGLLEIMGIPLLFIEQNSVFFIPMTFAVIILVIAMMILYMRIEAKYKK